MKIVICDNGEVYLRKLKDLLGKNILSKRHKVDIHIFYDSRMFLIYVEKEKENIVALGLLIDEMNGIDVVGKLILLQERSKT